MKTDYNKVVERKDVTVKNMQNMYKSHPRFKSKITWASTSFARPWLRVKIRACCLPWARTAL